MRVVLANLILTALLLSPALAEVIGTARGCALYKRGGEVAVLSGTAGEPAVTESDETLLIIGDTLLGYEFTCDLARSPISCSELSGHRLEGNYERSDQPDGTRMLFNGEVFGVLKPCR